MVLACVAKEVTVVRIRKKQLVLSTVSRGMVVVYLMLPPIASIGLASAIL